MEKITVKKHKGVYKITLKGLLVRETPDINEVFGFIETLKAEGDDKEFEIIFTK